MKPYYEDQLETIYHGDCREILPYLVEGVMVTDPVWPNATADLVGSDRPEALFKEAWDAGSKFWRRAAIQLGCNTPPWFLSVVTIPLFRICWLDVSRPNYKGRLLAGTDIGYLFGEPPSVIPGRMLIAGMCRDASADGQQTAHPCPRKLKHVKWLLRQWTDSWDIAVDPFAGSCTTALAAKSISQKSICIEIEERYCEMGANRLTQAMLDFEPINKSGTVSIDQSTMTLVP